MKTHARVKWVRTLGNFSYLLGMAFLIAAMAVNAIPAQRALAAKAAIWTTGSSCLDPDPQDENEYLVGETVYVRGKNFSATVSIEYKVIGTAGSSDPKTTVASGTTATNDDGYFCAGAYTVQPGDSGVYTVDARGAGDTNWKNDNYHVSGAAQATNTPVPTNTPTNTRTNTPTNTAQPGPSNTPTNTPTGTRTPTRTPTNTPTSGVTPTGEPGPGSTPSALIPVTGASLSGGAGLQTVFFNLGIGFLGLGLVLNGLARERKELDV